MSSTLDASASPAAARYSDQRAAYWPLPVARAVAAAVLAVAITFSADHSARLGLIAFGLFAVVTGVAVVVLAGVRLRDTPLRAVLLVQGFVSLALGVTALAVVALGATASVEGSAALPTLLVLLGSWCAATGLLELFAGVRARRRHVASADLLTVGVITLVTAFVFVLLPPDLADGFTNADGSSGVLDSSVVAVGVLGAYAAIIAVFLAIAGVSARGGAEIAHDTKAETEVTADPIPPQESRTGAES